MFFISGHTGSQVTAEWQIPRSGTPVIQLNIDPSELRRSYPIRVGLQGNAKAALRKMLEVAAPTSIRREWLASVKQLVHLEPESRGVRRLGFPQTVWFADFSAMRVQCRLAQMPLHGCTTGRHC